MGNKTPKSTFTGDSIESQEGKVFFVTGANTGLGLETCKVLASKGATVVMSFRNPEKSQKAVEAVEEIAKENNGVVETIVLDLGSLESVQQAADEFLEKNMPLHCLINNAGVMMCPKSTTKDGFEKQFGVNHLGHFALTARLFPALVETSRSNTVNAENPVRIVNLTSSAHSAGPKTGVMFDNLLWEKETPKYQPALAYGHSKFSNVVFTKELQDRLVASHEGRIQSYAVHPGFVDTELTRHAEKTYGKTFLGLYKYFRGALNVREGALTQLYTSVSSEVVEKNWGGEYFIPIAQRSDLDAKAPKITKEMQQKLWEVSEELTGVTFDVAA